MRAFRERLTRHDPRGRRWLFVPYDQLSAAIGPLAREPARELGIVVIESPTKAGQRPYHQQKLALVLANLRHFALEQAARGVAVRHLVVDGGYGDAIIECARELGPLRAMRPAERELRVDLQPAITAGALSYVDHEGWLTTTAQFRASQPRTPYRMDSFYRHVRRATGVLMDGERPAGGAFSHDADNRKRWRGTPPAPTPPRFVVDDVTAEVGALIRTRFGHHPGRLDLEALPATAADAERLWAWAQGACLASFGPYEDAMARGSRGLFHTRISALLNLHRLLPSRVVADALALALPLASQEGFVRQVLGWREFVHHVHEATDGFRAQAPVAAAPGDGGYARWAGRPWPRAPRLGDDGGACPSQLGAERPVPPAYWGTRSGMACVDDVVTAVWEDGYSHHITRLMVLSNLAALLDLSPRALTDWFWVAYTDAYDWVVEPNVLAMGSFGTDVMTTKPYVAGAAYIDRMSDYCRGCAFDPVRTCPFTRMYWAYLDRHRAGLTGNPRMSLALAAAARRAPADRKRDAAVFEQVSAALTAGERLTP